MLSSVIEKETVQLAGASFLFLWRNVVIERGMTHRIHWLRV